MDYKNVLPAGLFADQIQLWQRPGIGRPARREAVRVELQLANLDAGRLCQRLRFVFN